MQPLEANLPPNRFMTGEGHVMDYPQASQYLVDRITAQGWVTEANWPIEFREYVKGFIHGIAQQYEEMAVASIRTDVIARAEAQRWESMSWPTWKDTFHVRDRSTDLAQVREIAQTNGYRYFLWNDCVWETTGGFRVLKMYTDKEEARWTKDDIK